MPAKTGTADVLADIDRIPSETQLLSKGRIMSTVTNTHVTDTEHLIAREAGKTIEHFGVAEWDGTDVGWPVVWFASKPEREVSLVKYEPDSDWTVYFGVGEHGDLTAEQLAKLTEAARLADRLNTLTTNAVYFQDDHLEHYDTARKAAIATSCAYANCDGTMHDHLAAPAEWWHRVVAETFDGSSVLLDVSREPDGQYVGNISMAADGDVTAADLRGVPGLPAGAGRSHGRAERGDPMTVLQTPMIVAAKVAVNIADGAELIGVSKTEISLAITSRDLIAYRVEGECRILAEDLIAFIRSKPQYIDTMPTKKVVS
jgi:hypothetical protein